MKNLTNLSLHGLAPMAAALMMLSSGCSQDGSSQQSATPEIGYAASFDTANHYIDVDVQLSNLNADSVVLKLPVWAPGYYLIVDFPKNVTDFYALNGNGDTIGWKKQSKTEWIVDTKGQESITAKYRVFADERSVAESRVNDSVAFVAPNGVFMYLDGQKELPADVTFTLPETWKSASSGMKRLDDGSSNLVKFHSENADMLYDSPILFGNHKVVKFENDGKQYEIAMETPDGFEETTLVDDLKKMMSTAGEMVGEIPYDNYCYILLGAGGGGLEHTNSQADYTSGSFRFKDHADYLNFLSFLTHEYFHNYNVKRIRPIELGPFDYDKENYTPMLWVSEGFTVYYESNLLKKAGLVDGDYVLDELAGYIKTVESKNGHKHMSLRQSSYDIWLNFFNRNANGDDVRISYYNKGPILGLLMDIEIRRMTDNAKSLDDVMRTLYSKYYKEAQRGFTEEEFWQVCQDIAGQPLTEMRRYVDTTDEIDYDKVLGYAGLKLDRENWKLVRLDNVDESLRKIRESLFGE